MLHLGGRAQPRGEHGGVDVQREAEVLRDECTQLDAEESTVPIGRVRLGHEVSPLRG